MEASAEFTLTASDLERFVVTLSGDDTFTVLYLLTKADRPLSFESLCRNYGASPIEMKDRLDCLLSLKLVYKKGHAYVASAKAIIAMESLAKRLGSAELP